MVIQSTSLCNLDCSYCYLPDRQKKRVFDLDLIPLLVERIFESPYAGPEFSLVWHAGEPLTLPTNWYDKATTLINQSLQRFGAENLEIDQHVQTNATLINNDWCDCFRRNQIVVGISVDGPEDIHDVPIVASAMGGGPMPWQCEGLKPCIAIKCRFTASL